MRHYSAGGAGLLTAAVLEVVLRMLPLGVLGLFANLIVGLATGWVVKQVAKGASNAGPTAAISAACGIAIGVLFLTGTLAALFSFFFVLSALFAGYIAFVIASR